MMLVVNSQSSTTNSFSYVMVNDMKKLKSKVLVCFLALMIFMSAFTCLAGAASAGCNVVIDGISVKFDSDSGVPFIDKNNRTLVPLRKTMESYGCEVGWDQRTRTASVEMNGTVVLVGIGNKYIMVDDCKVEIDTEAQIVNSRTYLPIRAVLEAFGAEVNWINETRTVDVASPAYKAGQPKIMVESSNITLGVYDAYEVEIYQTLENASLNASVDDQSVVGLTKLSWKDSSEETAVLEFYAYKPGTAVITIDYDDARYTSTATIKVTVNAPKNYAKFPDVPDYGDFFGVDLYDVNDDTETYDYLYDAAPLAEIYPDGEFVELYTYLLMDSGFEYVGEGYTDTGGEGFFMENPDTGREIYFGYEPVNNDESVVLVVAVYK